MKCDPMEIENDMALVEGPYNRQLDKVDFREECCGMYQSVQVHRKETESHRLTVKKVTDILDGQPPYFFVAQKENGRAKDKQSQSFCPRKVTERQDPRCSSQGSGVE